MTCCQEVLDAIEQLHTATGHGDAAPGEVLARLRSNGSIDVDASP